MDEMEMMGMKKAGFPGEPGSGRVYGAIVQSENHIPPAEGVVLYLNANPGINPVLSRIQLLGGHVVLPKMSISPEIGYMAVFIDTEGNKVGIQVQSWHFAKNKKGICFLSCILLFISFIKGLFISAH